MAVVKNFNPAEYSIQIAGATASGFADGTFISVERTNDAFNMATGADGEVTRIASVDKSGTFTITLNQSSSFNDFLSNLFIADENTGKGAFPVLVKDPTGTSVSSAPVCWITKPATSGWSKDVETREWTIVAAHLTMFVGGNLDLATV